MNPPAAPSRPCGAEDRETIRRLLTDQIEELWGRGRTELVDANYADGVHDHMPVPGQPSGREALKDVVQLFRDGIVDMKMELHATLVAGDVGVDAWTLTGRHEGPLLGFPPTGKAVAIRGIDMIRVIDGRIADLWHVEEMAQLMAQIGADGPAPDAVPPAGRARVMPGRAEVYHDAADVPGRAAFTEREERTLAAARSHLDAVLRGLPDDPASARLQWLRSGSSDLSMRSDCIVIEGDAACIRWSVVGTHDGGPVLGLPSSGRRFSMNGMDMLRIDEDGRVKEIRHVEEAHQLREQLRRNS
jgi:steroid delta-isomerase-like uncharacterized protein